MSLRSCSPLPKHGWRRTTLTDMLMRSALLLTLHTPRSPQIQRNCSDVVCGNRLQLRHRSKGLARTYALLRARSV